MKNILTYIFLFGFSGIILSQTGNIRGKIISQENLPLAHADITIEGTQIYATSDSLGHYFINDLLNGQTYLLHINLKGYSPLSQTVTIKGDTILPDNQLQKLPSKKEKDIDDIIILGHKNKYAQDKSIYVSKLALKDIENPQVYNSIPQTLLKDQVITNFDDALKNATGIDKLWESTGRGGDGAGYFSLRGFPVQPTLVNGLPSLTNGSPDIQNTETIEVIKGPSGTLYGSSLISYGGLINVITKKPYAEFGGNLSYTTGTYGLNRVTADINTPLDTKKEVLLRVNAAYHDENSFQDSGFKRSLYLAPSLTYLVNDRLSFTINTEFYNGKSTNQTMLFLDRNNPLRVHTIKELGYNPYRSYTSNDLYLETPAYSLQGIANYKINKHWNSQTVLSRSSSKSEGYYSYLYEVSQYTPVTDGVVFQRYLNKQNSETYGTDIQQNFTGDFKIKNMRNRIVAGLDYYNQNITDNGSPYVSNGYVYVGNNQTQFNENMGGTTDDTGVLTKAGTDALLANQPIAPSKTKQETFSAYASNVLDIIPQLSVMASLRIDRFSNDSYNQTAFSPKFGIVYQPVVNKVSIFANYMNGFSNVAPVEESAQGVISKKSLNPEHANQIEFGTKLNLFKNKLIASLSYYDILVSDKSMRIDVDPTTYYYTQNGKQKNKGFETSLIINPISGLDIILGYSYVDSKLTRGDAEFLNKRPESSGPSNLVNFWANYRFPEGILHNFGIGFGGNYASENKVFNRNGVGTFTLPEYTIINASAFYEIKSFRITLKLDNITDKEYYKGWSTISPQKPRIFSANLSYSF